MESSFHELLKDAVLDELKKEGYELYVEPSDPPMSRVEWNFYRPDIFGIICNETTFDLLFAECETNPNIERINGKISKIKRWLTFQKRLNESHDFNLVLAIPTGMLRRVNCRLIRKIWDVWIVSCKGKIVHKMPKIRD